MTKWLLSLFWLFALLNPFYKKYDYGGEWPLLIIFSLLLLVLVLINFRLEREKITTENILLLIFTTFILLSFYFSQTQNVGFSEVIAFISVIPLYLILAPQKINYQNHLFKTIVLGSLIAASIGFYFYIFKAEPRMFGPFFNLEYHAHEWPNAFALYLLISWPIFLLVLRKKALIVPLTIIFSALIFTFSRGALIVLAGQLVLLVLLNLKNFRFKNILTALIIGAFSILLFNGINNLRAEEHATLNIEDKVKFENSEALTSKQERKDFWLGAIELAKEEPLFGYGPFSFRYAYNPIQKTLLGSADHPHNFFLKIAAENGIIALSSLLVFFLYLIFLLFKRYSQISDQNKFTIKILLVSLSGAIAHNMIDYNFNFMANWLLFWLLIIIARSNLTLKTEKNISIMPLMISISLLIFVIYEHLNPNTYYSRNYYLALAEKGDSLALEKQLNLNPLDPQAYYLKGALECAQIDFENCFKSFHTALNLNPLNDLNYHQDYLRVLIKLNKQKEIKSHLEFSIPILKKYAEFVEKNIHFTAYTNQVEIAADYIDMIVEVAPEHRYLLNLKQKMLSDAEEHRKNKTF